MDTNDEQLKELKCKIKLLQKTTKDNKVTIEKLEKEVIQVYNLNSQIIQKFVESIGITAYEVIKDKALADAFMIRLNGVVIEKITNITVL